MACESSNVDVVKYIVSLNEIDINSKSVFLPFFVFLMKF